MTEVNDHASVVDHSNDELIQVDDLILRGRIAIEAIASADQSRVDELVTALAWSLYKPKNAQRLAETRRRRYRDREHPRQSYQKPTQDVWHLTRPDAGAHGRRHQQRP